MRRQWRAFLELRQAELQEAKLCLLAQERRYLRQSGQQKLGQPRHRHLCILHGYYTRRKALGQHQPQEILVFGDYIVAVLPGITPDIGIGAVV